jgi:hypothetical protein
MIARNRNRNQKKCWHRNRLQIFQFRNPGILSVYSWTAAVSDSNTETVYTWRTEAVLLEERYMCGGGGQTVLGGGKRLYWETRTVTKRRT